MNTPQENKLTMYPVVQDFLAASANLTATLPAFAAGVTSFNSELGQLQALASGSYAETKGLTADKAARKDITVRLAVDMASLLKPHVLVTGDNQALDFPSGRLPYPELRLPVWKAAEQMTTEIKQQQDPRLNGQGEIFDRYPYADPRSARFHERCLKGETLNQGWVSPSDFEKGPIED